MSPRTSSTSNGNGNGFESYSATELVALQNKITALIEQKRAAEKVALREKLVALATKGGFDLSELISSGARHRKIHKYGKVAPKYQDPSHPENTWTGRGRMPRWMVAATRGKKLGKEDFLIR